MESKKKQDIAVVVLTVLSAIAQVLVFVFNALASTGQSIFKNSVTNVSDNYMTDITPAGYTFAIWGIIYAWISVWTLYALINIFRKNNYGPVLLNPVILTIPVQVFWILSGVSNIVWLVIWCNEELFIAFIVIVVFTLCGYIAMGFLFVATEKQEVFIRKESKVDYVLTYVLIHNGMAVLFSWTTVATMVNLSIFLTYDPILDPNMSSRDASIVALSILLAIALVWAVLENTVFFKYVKYLYVWYFVIIWAGAGVLVGNYDIENPNTILTIVLICVAVVCFFVKLGVYFYRTKTPTVDVGDLELRRSPL